MEEYGILLPGSAIQGTEREDAITTVTLLLISTAVLLIAIKPRTNSLFSARARDVEPGLALEPFALEDSPISWWDQPFCLRLSQAA